MEEWPEKSCYLVLKTRTFWVGDSPNVWRKVLWSDETWMNFSATKENAMSGANPTHPITPRTPSPQYSMVVAASCCGDVFQQQGLGDWSKSRERKMVLNTGIFLSKTYVSLPVIWDWAGGSRSSRTMTGSRLFLAGYFFLFVVCFTMKN